MCNIKLILYDSYLLWPIGLDRTNLPMTRTIALLTVGLFLCWLVMSQFTKLEWGLDITFVPAWTAWTRCTRQQYWGMTRFGSWITNRRLFPESTPLFSGNEWRHCLVQNKNPAMNDVTAGYKIRIRQWMTSLPGTKQESSSDIMKFGNLLHIKNADSYYILPVLSSRQNCTKVWLPGKKYSLTVSMT